MSELKLHLLSPRHILNKHDLELNNRCFELWSNFWLKIYRDANSEDAFKLDDYYRQDFVGAIVQNENPVAMWMSSRFHIQAQATEKHSYFKFYDADFKSWLSERAIQEVMSVEFMTVDPSFRRSGFKVSLGKVIAGLTTQALVHSQTADALIATARTDVPAAAAGYQVGYEPVQVGVLRRNFKCDLVACQKKNVKLSPDLRANAVVQDLWATRTETGLDLFMPSTLSKAA